MTWFERLASLFGEPLRDKGYDYVVVFRFHTKAEYDAFVANIAPLYEVTPP